MTNERKQYVQPTNRGTLFVNDKKQKDSHPDFKGSINIDGKEWALAAWNKEGNRGDYLSLAVSEPWTGNQKSEASNNF